MHCLCIASGHSTCRSDVAQTEGSMSSLVPWMSTRGSADLSFPATSLALMGHARLSVNSARYASGA
jgi:hypothetical protein